MAPNRSQNYRAQSYVSRHANPAAGGHYDRRPARLVPSRQIDGVTASASTNRELIPANQQEYITSLASAPTARRPIQQQNAEHGSANIFGINTLISARQRFGQVKAVLPAVFIVLIMIGSIAGLISWRSGESAGAERTRARSSIETTEENGEISEKRPTNIQSYQVAGELPRYVRINDMGLTSRIRRVGVGEDTELKLPSNIYDVGWYESSVKPGEDGAVVLTGHAMGPTKPGIFYDLKELKPGDTIDVETGDGQVFSYYVVKLEAFSSDDPLAPLLASAVPGSPGLNLITESGSFDEKANTYDQRLVVYAVQDNVTPSPTQTTDGASLQPANSN